MSDLWRVRSCTSVEYHLLASAGFVLHFWAESERQPAKHPASLLRNRCFATIPAEVL